MEELAEKFTDATRAWRERHGNRVLFYGEFIELDEEGNTIGSQIFCYGDKSVVKKRLKGFIDDLAAEEFDFVYW